MKNDNIKSVVVLTAISLIVAALLAVTNFFTAPVIEANKAAAATRSLSIVMPEGKDFVEMQIPADAPATVTGLYEESSGQGYVVMLTTSSQYSSDDMTFTIGVGTDGVIKGVAMTGYYESKDFGADYPQTYVGADSALNGIDTYAGVTYSSTAFKNAVSDAFEMLLNSGSVSAGAKSEETLTAEVMPLALPGCADSLGSAHVTEIDAAGFVAAYQAENNSGYVVVAEEAGAKVVVGINAFGDACAFDLEGNPVDVPAGVADAFAALADQNMASNKSNAEKAMSGASAEAITVPGAFGIVTGAFTATTADGTFYAFNVVPFGYANELMEMVVVVDEDGNIVNYKTVSELILHGEYYSSHDLTNESAYKEQFIGLNEGTYSDDLTIIAGATFTQNAVADSIHAAFDAYKAVKEAK